MIVLDATIRDGGYYTDWKFDLSLVNLYLNAIESSGVNAVEIGFRNQSKTDFACVMDNFICEKLYIPKVKYFGVMIDAASATVESINDLFTYVDKSPINLVRVATHFKDIYLAEGICKELKSLGYTICCNLMQASDRSYEEIRNGAMAINKWGVVDCLYLADSLGGMNHDDVNYAFSAIKEGWAKETGFHGHNNRGQALSNTLEAIDIGVDWVDGTILGMGRGPGNTETEYLLMELNKRGFGEFHLSYLYRLAIKEFKPLKEKYGWGQSLFYYLSAEYSIHPIYIQKMIFEKHNVDKILCAIDYLRYQESNSFHEHLYKESLS